MNTKDHHIHNTSFSSQLMNGPDKLECFSLPKPFQLAPWHSAKRHCLAHEGQFYYLDVSLYIYTNISIPLSLFLSLSFSFSLFLSLFLSLPLLLVSSLCLVSLSHTHTHTQTQTNKQTNLLPLNFPLFRLLSWLHEDCYYDLDCRIVVS